MDRVRAYLSLNRAYCDYLGGLRWSTREDALAYPDERIYVFHPHLVDFIYGLSKGGKLIPFSQVLHLLDLLRNSRGQVLPALIQPSRLFLECGKNYLNAGALAAVLCTQTPPYPDPPTFTDVCDRLVDQEKPIRWLTTTFLEKYSVDAQWPAADPGEFEGEMVRQLGTYSEEDLRAWFTTGRGPVRQAGEELARRQPTPRTLSGVLAALLERPRLAGAANYVTQLIGALTLPPRRLAPQELPVGGYADLANHGSFEAILPAQFALEELEFFRRFAERELLFFRREEPPAQNQQELVVLLDQGVRTWGDVRLVLAAAALALGKQAMQRQVPLLLAATSNEGRVVQPLEATDQELGRLVEASDLSADPGLALDTVLQTSSAALRDVVLLSHPRSLRAADVAAAARRLGPRDRLFGVALDAKGQVEVSQFRHGTPVRFRQFRVDFQAAQQPTTPKSTQTPSPSDWAGDVEPYGFPFRFGLEGPADRFDFDYASDWLLTSSTQGMLHLWKTDGSAMEVLPRGMMGGQVLNKVEGLVGVAGGFVVGGRMNQRIAAFHYDLATRRCRLHTLGTEVLRPTLWSYSWVHHCVQIGQEGGQESFAFDLDTGKVASTQDTLVDEPLDRAHRALGFINLVKPLLRLTPDLRKPDQEFPTLGFESTTGSLILWHKQPPWPAFTPLADGQPFLRGARILEAQCWNRVLAVKAQRPQGMFLHLFQGPEGTPLLEFPLRRAGQRFALSRNGQWLARQTDNLHVEVRLVDGSGQPMLTRSGGFSQLVNVELVEGCLTMVTGEYHVHTLDWREPKLAYLYEKRPPSKKKSTPPKLTDEITYDPQRFLHFLESNGLFAFQDRFGQVVLTNHRGETLAIAMAFRDRFALWLPDGSCMGSPALLRGAPTPGVLERLEPRLRQADSW